MALAHQLAELSVCKLDASDELAHRKLGVKIYAENAYQQFISSARLLFVNTVKVLRAYAGTNSIPCAYFLLIKSILLPNISTLVTPNFSETIDIYVPGSYSS
jgi:hypothetical protein